jgi:hypothetical protein
MDPVVGNLLASGLGLLANAVAVKGRRAMSEQTGVNLDQPNLSQESLVALKRYQAEHEEELLNLKLEDNRLELGELTALLADRKDACKRETEIATSEHAPLVNRIASPVIAFATILLTFVLFYVAVFSNLALGDGKKDVILYILGVLSAISTQIFSYYFGSSQGSAEKTRAINDMLEARR